MSAIDELLAGNERYAAEPAEEGLAPAPSRRVVVVTCMDARLDVYAALGLGRGEAHVLRNAGGVVTDDVIRSLAVSQRKLGTREVMLVHHSRCGMQSLDGEAFRAELAADAGAEPPFEIGAFADLEADVRESISRVRESPFLPHRDAVRGFVYDVDSRQLHEVDAGG